MTFTGSTNRGPAVGGAVPLAVGLQGVRKRFGHVQAVRDVDISISSGEIAAILGPNCAGKTSTIDMILGLSQPTAGEVSVFGMHPRQAITRGLVSAVMQTGGLLKDLTVVETDQETASLFAHSRPVAEVLDRKSTRLNSSHRCISYAVFCLK